MLGFGSMRLPVIGKDFHPRPLVGWVLAQWDVEVVGKIVEHLADNNGLTGIEMTPLILLYVHCDRIGVRVDVVHIRDQVDT